MVGMISALGIEARSRHLAPRTLSLGHQLPQARGVSCIPRELASQADNGDGLTCPSWPGASHGCVEGKGREMFLFGKGQRPMG